LGVLSERTLLIRDLVVVAVALDALSGLLPALPRVEPHGHRAEGSGEVRGRVENEREALHAVAALELVGDRRVAHELGLAPLWWVLLTLVEPADVNIELVLALIGVVGERALARRGGPVAPLIGFVGATGRGVEGGVRLVALALEGGSFVFVAARVLPAGVALGELGVFSPQCRGGLLGELGVRAEGVGGELLAAAALERAGEGGEAVVGGFGGGDLVAVVGGGGEVEVVWSAPASADTVD